MFTRKRLDRAICNLEWHLRFQSSKITHLPKLKSDHSPLLMTFDDRRHDVRGRRPFLFEAIWFNHPTFNQLVENNWRGSIENFPRQLKELQVVLKEWNKDTFGNIFIQKKRLMNKLRDIDRRLSHGWNDHLLNIQKSTWLAYEDILAKEELLWFQKSRAKWIEFGDRNTNYFHGVATIRRRRNRITTLQDYQGVWVSDPRQLEALATNYFRNLFSNSEVVVPYPFCRLFPILDIQSLNDMVRELSNDEIASIVRSIGAYKAPGSDGY